MHISKLNLSALRLSVVIHSKRSRKDEKTFPNECQKQCVIQVAQRQQSSRIASEHT